MRPVVVGDEGILAVLVLRGDVAVDLDEDEMEKFLTVQPGVLSRSFRETASMLLTVNSFVKLTRSETTSTP